MSEMMNSLAKRTNGDVYIGVVGPVRVGKSTLVKKMMEQLVIPNLQDEAYKQLTIDELPQSSPGPVIMTAEPKFVPAQSTPIQVEGIDLPFRIRFADCVGYVVDGAKGYEHEGKQKLVHTPWHPEPIPFIEAAKIGTDKVINDHASIGLVVTTDGSINGFTRHSVEQAEKEIMNELFETKKPIILILNSIHPYKESTVELKNELLQKYGVPVINCNIEQLSVHQLNEILREALYEFPLNHLELVKPDWVDVLSADTTMQQAIHSIYNDLNEQSYKVRQMNEVAKMFESLPFVTESNLLEIDTSTGNAKVQLCFSDESFIEACQNLSGERFETKKDWICFIKEASSAKKTQERFREAIEEAENEGYGIALPAMDQFIPSEPELIKQNDFFGVKMKALAPSYHIIRIDLEAEFAPLIGSEFHSKQLLKELKNGYENNQEALWNISLFGTTLSDVLKESLKYKMEAVPKSAKKRMRFTIERMVNEGDNGVVTFIL